MKVGGSPLYYTKAQEAMLENFFQYLNQKENEAVNLLKEKGFLIDSEQHPAIRVALRGLKDFAFPINRNGIIVWRYFLVNEENMPKLEYKAEPISEPKKEEVPIIQTPEIISKEPEQPKIIEIKQENSDFDKMKKELEEKRIEIEKLKEEIQVKSDKKPQKENKSPPKKQQKPIKAKDETFLNAIKEILAKKSQEIISIEEFDKKYAILKVKSNEKELLVAAFDKKKLEDNDLLAIAKRANALNIEYSLIFKGELSKKTKEIIEAYKRLNSTEKID